MIKNIIAALLILPVLSACGGGAQPQARTIVRGIVSKGPFTEGTVKIYSITNGVQDIVPLGSYTIYPLDTGHFTVDLGSYAGPIIAEASGKYLDEASGTTMSVTADRPLRAALSRAQGNVTLAVTALTELAVQSIGSNLNPDAINAANNLFSQIFKVDITGVLPMAPNSAALPGASQAQKDYTLALATISQLAQDSNSSLASTLTSLLQGTTYAGMDTTTITALQSALTNFVTPTDSNTNNKSVITDTLTTSLVNVGTLSASYRLALAGTGAAGAIKGVQFDLVLPGGVNLNLNGVTSALLDSSLAPSGSSSAGLLLGKYTSGSHTVTIGLTASAGLKVGEFATLTCNVLPGGSAPPAAVFAVRNLRGVDADGKTVNGVTVTVN